MSELDDLTQARIAVKECPFCGGEPEVQENRMNSVDMGGKRPPLISVSIRHHCGKLAGCVNAFIEFRGRDHESAVAQWNRRIFDPKEPPHD